MFGGHRRYKATEKISNSKDERLIVGYARVSFHDQTKDLEIQKATLLQHKINVLLADVGSGLNFKKSGFNKLMILLLNNKIKKNYYYAQRQIITIWISDHRKIMST